jgi:predicted RNase H-like nuclease
MSDLKSAGYPLATNTDRMSCSGCRTIEVFPHPALLVLLRRPYRVPYKVGKSTKYWKGTDVSERKAKLLAEFAEIDKGLRGVFSHTLIEFPLSEEITLSQLKRYEDALDALVSAWVGTEFLSQSATPYGDETATIWVPADQGARIS